MEALESNRFHELLHEHKAAIANYLRRRLHPPPKEDLFDLVKETLVILWRRIHDVPTGDGALPWAPAKSSTTRSARTVAGGTARHM